MSACTYALIRFWLSVGFFGCAALFYLCLTPNPPAGLDVPYFDKLEHFSAYLVLGTWFAGILAPHYARVFIGLFAFGILIEILQGLTGFRDAQIGDAVADGLGTIAGIGLAHLGAMRWLGYIDQRVAAKSQRATAKNQRAAADNQHSAAEKNRAG